jgi:5-methylcytosine-specific restriction endonuclease McrA
MARVRDSAWRRQSGRCFYCRSKLEVGSASADHYVPNVLFGSRTSFYRPNIVASCTPCNDAKGEAIPWPFLLVVLSCMASDSTDAGTWFEGHLLAVRAFRGQRYTRPVVRMRPASFQGQKVKRGKRVTVAARDGLRCFDCGTEFASPDEAKLRRVVAPALWDTVRNENLVLNCTACATPPHPPVAWPLARLLLVQMRIESIVLP